MKAEVEENEIIQKHNNIIHIPSYYISYNEESFFKAVEGVEAKGWTPLAEAIKVAREANSLFGLLMTKSRIKLCDRASRKAIDDQIEKKVARSVIKKGY